MKIYNGTPHSIKIIDRGTVEFKKELRKWVSENPTVVTEIPSDGILSAQIETVYDGNISNIPSYTKKIVSCDGLPIEYDIIIVSQLYASAAKMFFKNVSKLYTVADPVYSSDGRTILGCLGICSLF